MEPAVRPGPRHGVVGILAALHLAGAVLVARGQALRQQGLCVSRSPHILQKYPENPRG